MLKKIIGIGGSLLSISIISFGFDKILPLFTSEKLYGTISLLISFEAIFIITGLMGYNRVIFNFFNKEKTPTIFWTNFFYYWKYILLFSFFFNLLIINYLVNFKFSTILLISLIITFSSIQKMLLMYFRMHAETKNIYYYNTLVLFLKCAIVLLLIEKYPFLETYLLITLITYFLVMIPLAKKIKQANNKLLNKQTAKKYFLFALPLVFSYLGSSFITYFDRIFIHNIMDMESVGIYSFGYGFGASIVFLIGIFNAYLEPYIINIKTKLKNSYKILTYYISFLTICFLAFSFLIFFAVPYLINTTYPDSYTESITVFKIALVSHLVFPMIAVMPITLEINKKTKYISYAYIIAAIINIILNWILINKLGIIGAVAATYISFIALVLLFHFFIEKKCKIKTERTSYLNIILFIGMFFSTYYQKDIPLLIFFIITFLINIKGTKNFLTQIIGIKTK